MNIVPRKIELKLIELAYFLDVPHETIDTWKELYNLPYIIECGDEAIRMVSFWNWLESHKEINIDLTKLKTDRFRCFIPDWAKANIYIHTPKKTSVIEKPKPKLRSKVEYESDPRVIAHRKAVAEKEERRKKEKAERQLLLQKEIKPVIIADPTKRRQLQNLVSDIKKMLNQPKPIKIKKPSPLMSDPQLLEALKKTEEKIREEKSKQKKLIYRAPLVKENNFHEKLGKELEIFEREYIIELFEKGYTTKEISENYIPVKKVKEVLQNYICR